MTRLEKSKLVEKIKHDLVADGLLQDSINRAIYGDDYESTDTELTKFIVKTSVGCVIVISLIFLIHYIY
jgi:hypothetical protein